MFMRVRITKNFILLLLELFDEFDILNKAQKDVIHYYTAWTIIAVNFNKKKI